jgi:hypothetical protein
VLAPFNPYWPLLISTVAPFEFGDYFLPPLWLSILNPAMADPHHNYSIMTKRRDLDFRWEWEIVRDDQPLGARIRGGPFKFEQGAIDAGTAALNAFLKLLKREQHARRRLRLNQSCS